MNRFSITCSQLPLANKFDKLESTGPLVLVGFILGQMYVTCTWIYIPLAHVPLLSWPSVFFHTCFGLAVASYHNGVVTHPGKIPESWRTSPPRQSLERKRRGQLRFCSKEHKYKPDRAHFCHQMSCNVLRMDHYCPWLSNCIGFYNHKYFLLFLVYSVGVTDLLSWKLMMMLLTHPSTLPPMALVMFSHTLLLSGLLGLLLTPFLGFHLWLLAKNMTTIEFCEKRSGSSNGYQSPYDIGLYSNIASIFGDDWRHWPLPIGAPTGEGTVFPVAAWATEAADVAGASEESYSHESFLALAPAPAVRPIVWAPQDEADSSTAASSGEAVRRQQPQQEDEPQPSAADVPGEQPKTLPQLLGPAMGQVGQAVCSTLRGGREGARECCADLGSYAAPKVAATAQCCADLGSYAAPKVAATVQWCADLGSAAGPKVAATAQWCSSALDAARKSLRPAGPPS